MKPLCVRVSSFSKAVLGGTLEFGWKERHSWCRDLLIQMISIKPNLFKWLQLFRDRLTC